MAALSDLRQATPRLGTMAADKAAASGRIDVGRVVRLLTRFVADQRRQFLLAFVMLTAEAVTAVLQAYPLAYLIDYLKGDKPDLLAALNLPELGLPELASPRIGTVAILTSGIIVFAAINSLADSLSEVYLAKGGQMLGFNLRAALYAHLQRLSLGFHTRGRVGDMLTRVTGDVAALEQFVTASLSDIAGSVLLLVGTLAFLLYSAWQVALVAAVIVPILALVGNYFSQRITTAARRQRAREGDLASTTQEMLTSIRLIQTYGREDHEQSRFTVNSRKSMDAALEAAFLQARFSWTVKVLEALAIAAIVWLGLWLLDRAAITVGSLVLFVILIDNMFKPTKKIIKEWNTIGRIYASVERISEVLERRPAVAEDPGAIEAPRLKGNVEFRQVSFTYELASRAAPPVLPVDGAATQSRLALRDISFSIAPGEVLALVGPTGAGKSTIAQLLPRLYDPHAGQVLIDGYDIRTFTFESLRSQISMVLQETILFAGTVAENIAYGRSGATGQEIITAAIQANAHPFIQKLPVSYLTLLGERGANLSGGQRQLIAIARAFIRNAPILILDEPTTGLDAESADLVLRALRTLMKGKTTVVISHDLKLIRDADTIMVIRDGQVDQVGTHEALLAAQGLYASMYHKQFGQAAAEHADGRVSARAATFHSGAGVTVVPTPGPPVPSARVSC